MLRQREIEAGVTYLSNEPIGDVSAVPIYREEYLLLTTADGPLGDADRVTWSQAGRSAVVPARARYAKPAYRGQHPAAYRHRTDSRSWKPTP